MIHDSRIFGRIDQVTAPPRPPATADGRRPTVIVPGESRYQKRSAKLPAQPGSLRFEPNRPPSQPGVPTTGSRRREMTRPAPGRTMAAVRRALDSVVRRRH